MKPTYLYNELTAVVSSGEMAAAVTGSGLAMVVSGNQMIIDSVLVVENNASDVVFELLILDVFGEPILDVNGQYIIGG